MITDVRKARCLRSWQAAFRNRRMATSSPPPPQLAGGLPGTPCGYSSGAADATVSGIRNLAPAPLANARAAACRAAGAESGDRDAAAGVPAVIVESDVKTGDRDAAVSAG